MVGDIMSQFNILRGINPDGDPQNIIISDRGNQVTEPVHSLDNHEGNVFHLSRYFGDIADDGIASILITVGADKDIHLLDLMAELEGTWLLNMFENPSIDVAGTTITPQCTNRFEASVATAALQANPTTVSTVVDAASGGVGVEKILNVTDTAGFELGHTILIDSAGNYEFAVIDTIQAGVSLTLTENLENTYTNETVEATGIELYQAHAEGGGKNDSRAASPSAGAPWIFKAGEKYLLRMTNITGADARASQMIYWAEVAKQT